MNFYKNTLEQKQKITEFKNELITKIEEPNFKTKIIQLFKIINFYKAQLKQNTLVYKTSEKEPRRIIISITEKDIHYSEEKLNYITTGIYHFEPTGKSYIKYTTTETTIYKNVYKGKRHLLYDLYNIKKETNFQTFDETKKEIWYLNETKCDNYYQNKLNKEKILTTPNHFENYTEKNYYFRENEDLIIARRIKQYQQTKEQEGICNEDFCLIGKNYFPDNKRLPRGGYYSGIPKEIFTSYKLGQCNLEELKKSRVRKK